MNKFSLTHTGFTAMRNMIAALVFLTLAGCNLSRPTQPAPVAQISTQASVFLTASALPVLKITPPILSTAVTQLAVSLTPTSILSSPSPSANPSPSASPSPSPTPSPTRLPPTATSQPSSTPAPDDPRQALGNPTWKDTFATGKSFYLYKDEHIEVKVENDALVMTGLNADGWHGWSLTHSVKAQNFYVEGIFKTKTCTGADAYGLVVRAPSDEAGYFASITCDGRYKLHKWDSSKSTDILPLTSAPAIKSGSNQTNRFGVKAVGQTLSLYANGIKIKELTDSTYPDEGYIGGFVVAVKTAGFTVEMEEINYWKLP